MEKIVRDGYVAVAVSCGYGAGWSTWADVDPMDARFNQLFLDGKYDEAIRLGEYLDIGYLGGIEGVVIEWVPEGTRFIIEDYDGAESIQTPDGTGWLEA
jgi:hypothetical protein